MVELRRAIIIRYSEIAVKGWRTRSRMENLLVNAINDTLKKTRSKATLSKVPGRIIVWDPEDIDEAKLRLSRIFGVKSLSPAYSTHFETLSDIVEVGKQLFSEKVKGKIFRVSARRVGSHDFTSKDIERILGGELYNAGAKGVNLKNPEYTVYVEVRGNSVFFYDEVIPGPGGLPVGSEEPILVLFSGGFDSTASAWLVFRRGSRAGLLFFDLGDSYAKRIAFEAAEKLRELWGYGFKFNFYSVDYSALPLFLQENIRPEYRVLVLRRLMLLHASRIAENHGYEALATGDNIGQVASQTVRNLRLIGASVPLPVIRPVAGYDKDEIMQLVKRIGLYDIVNKQVEVCGRGVHPVPRASPKIFREEFDKLWDAFQRGEFNIRVEEKTI